MQNKHIVLIGFMGSGKSTVGPMLARSLNLPFTDLDLEVSKRSGDTIAQLFSKGEKKFRDIETKILQQIIQQPQRVIATGGGTIMTSINRELLKFQSHIFWLDATPRSLWNRLQQKAKIERPLMAKCETLQNFANLYASRIPYYRMSHNRIDTSLLTPSSVAQLMATAING